MYRMKTLLLLVLLIQPGDSARVSRLDGGFQSRNQSVGGTAGYPRRDSFDRRGATSLGTMDFSGRIVNKLRQTMQQKEYYILQSVTTSGPEPIDLIPSPSTEQFGQIMKTIEDYTIEENLQTKKCFGNDTRETENCVINDEINDEERSYKIRNIRSYKKSTRKPSTKSARKIQQKKTEKPKMKPEKKNSQTTKPAQKKKTPTLMKKLSSIKNVRKTIPTTKGTSSPKKNMLHYQNLSSSMKITTFPNSVRTNYSTASSIQALGNKTGINQETKSTDNLTDWYHFLSGFFFNLGGKFNKFSNSSDPNGKAGQTKIKINVEHQGQEGLFNSEMIYNYPIITKYSKQRLEQLEQIKLNVRESKRNNGSSRMNGSIFMLCFILFVIYFVLV